MEAAGAKGTEQGRTQTTKETGTGPEQEQGKGQVRGRIARREGWEDQAGPFFGGSPFALFRRLSDDMDRLFFGGGPSLGAFSNAGGRFVPNVDVEEHEDTILVRADLPGVRPDDFRVDIEDDALVLQGERRIEREETHGGVRRVERSHGSFRRIIPLPQAANLEAAEARFENGVLEIEVPLQKETKARRLEVRSGSGSTGDSTRH
jgi:HSP20 family protein